ncbi:hypothetical protein BABINDRAFT_155178 [Babjeviella inositovora NRRL Y-12698]|uniref:Uncharacterized protein n=1 Tax=Babjeviella inositovora NRRL Y-12698 TaxID=984486 RepID=A0A1E3QMM5_9ASCO|nr:uncharacterized protein BABINDRAFT_155178 [Babjeviella inositovora NRRL Y-12698]ODQ78939.1 hypothetical protein BABINDRAFT_155178 [Babjeviella inositovora NRRL Y-12698]
MHTFGQTPARKLYANFTRHRTQSDLKPYVNLLDFSMYLEFRNPPPSLFLDRLDHFHLYYVSRCLTPRLALGRAKPT